ncbi:DUF2029 domain-containing protein [Streptomyces cacaoi]|nr:DUF2029 domain-containing protein [Streptomyces cacaoi]
MDSGNDPGAGPRLAGRVSRHPALYGGFAVFAALTAAVTALPPHRLWGTIAAAGYGLSALALALAAAPRTRVRTRARAHVSAHTRACGPASSAVPASVTGRRGAGAVVVVAFLTAAVLPLLVLVARDSAQEEVAVVHRAAARLLVHGTPYAAPAALDGADHTAYNPYLPGMALFGLPHRLAGVDARFVFGAVFAVTFATALRTSVRRIPRVPRAPRVPHTPRTPCAPAGPRQGRPTAAGWTVRTLALCASPLVALPLAVGGDDLPVIGLCCLGLALAGRGDAGRAGLVLGLAGTLKATAWPALPVAAALLAVYGGRRAVARFGTGAAMPLVCGVGLPALADPGGLLANTVRYPLGLADAASPAAAPLPGRLLAGLGTGGHTAAVVLLALAAVAVAVSLVLRPPRDAPAAALRLALGLCAAMALMPASRFGYLVHPLVLALWAHWRKPDAPTTAPPALPAAAAGAGTGGGAGAGGAAPLDAARAHGRLGA